MPWPDRVFCAAREDHFLMSSIDSAVLERHGLKPDEYERIVRAMQREPTLTELGIFSVMWSEHCSYKSSRIHLKKLPTTGARVLQGPGENAGAVDIGDGLAAVFKIESHNHPSFIEPYQGAATGVGGIIRDIFTMGARPIALMNSLRFGSLDGPDGARNRRIVEGVVAGIAGYGNSIGIPTVGGEIAFDDSVLRQSARQRVLPRYLEGRCARQGQRLRRRESRVLRRRQDRTRRHPWRHHGVGGVRRELFREASRGAGGRSVHGEAAPRGVPRADADRRAHRRPGHGRCRPDVLDVGDGRPRRQWHRDRCQPRSATRDRHDAVRDHAVRIAGAHAARRQEGPGSRGRGDLREVGSARRSYWRRDDRRHTPRAASWRDRRRDSEWTAGRRGAGLQPSRRAPGVSGRSRQA